MWRGWQIGFGPRSFQGCGRRLKKCWEDLVSACDYGPTDGCCGVVQCKWCLSLEIYDDTFYGVATWNGTRWVGAVGGYGFEAWWSKDEYDVCYLVVSLDGQEVTFEQCHEVTCREPGGSAEVAPGNESGTLTWSIHKPLPLVHTTDEYTSCKVPFCGDCECTCRSLCAIIYTSDCAVCGGELITDDSGYGSGVVWEGEVSCAGEIYSLSVALVRDPYTGECLLGGTMTPYSGGDPIVLEDSIIEDCEAIAMTWTLDDGTVVFVGCKQCDCGVTDCTVGCCFPYESYDPMLPCGNVPDIPFSISAPGCSFDELEGVFIPDSTGLTIGECGPACVDSGGLGAGEPLPGTRAVPAGQNCFHTECLLIVSLRLECVDDAGSAVGLDSCCGKLRLVFCSSEPLEGSVAGEPGECPYRIEFAPTSCECLPGGAGFAAVFEVSIPGCSDLFDSGPCVGEGSCCKPECPTFTVTI